MVRRPRHVRPRRVRRRPAVKKPMRASKALTNLISKVVSKKAEHKAATYYGCDPSIRRTVNEGIFAFASNQGQNQYIQSNATDILRVLPIIYEGTADYERVGNQISPTSLAIHCNVGINNALLPTTSAGTGLVMNLYAVCYLLQHKQLKSYEQLNSLNNFNQLLNVGNGTTVRFNGSFTQAFMPVSNQYYTVLAKKILNLRSDGVQSGPASGTAILNANSHPNNYNFTWHVKKKHLPAKLKYPEVLEDISGGFVAGNNDPTNSSLFWCVGFYKQDGSPVAGSGVPLTWIQQQYMARLTYTDS